MVEVGGAWTREEKEMSEASTTQINLPVQICNPNQYN